MHPVLYNWCTGLILPLIKRNKYFQSSAGNPRKQQKDFGSFLCVSFFKPCKAKLQKLRWYNPSYSTLSNIFNSIIRTRQLITSVSTRVLVGVVVVVLEKKTSLICQSPPHHVHQFIITFALPLSPFRVQMQSKD